MYSVELITDQAAFVGLGEAWNDAVDRAGATHPFLRHEWFRTWWEAFGGNRRLHVLIVRRNHTICAIAPLMLERTRMYGLPVRSLRLLHNDHTPRADLIVAEHTADAYQAIWHALMEERNRWDVLQLNQLPAESPTRDVFGRLAADAGHPTGTWQGGASPYLRLTSTWTEYHAGLSSKFRQNLRNRLSRLAQFGEPALEILDDADAIHSAQHDAQRLENSGWKETEGTAIRSDPAVERFYTLLAERARECSWLRLLFLTVGGQRIATSYSAVYQNRLFLLKTGYDPQFAKCSPFKLLTSFAVRQAFEAGFTEVDFLGDPEPWKLEWTATTRPHEWLFIFSGTPRARLLHPLKFQFGPAMKRFQSPSACTSQPSRA